MKKIIFYHGYIYGISVCFLFPSTVKVSIRNYNCTIRASIYRSWKRSFLSWLFMQDFCMFFIFKYSEGINTKLHLHYKSKYILILKKIIFYQGYIYRISVCFVFPSTVKVSIQNFTCTIRASIDLKIDHFLFVLIPRLYLEILNVPVQKSYTYIITITKNDQFQDVHLVL